MNPINPRTNDVEQLLRVRHHGDALREFLLAAEPTSFQTDRQLLYAISMAVLSVSEALYMLTKQLKEQFPNIRWSAIGSLRHLMVHDYIEVSPQRLWEEIHQEILPALDALDSILPPATREE